LERLKEANLASKRVRVQTLHGFANFLIRKYRRAAGIPNYRILSQESSEQMVKRLVGKTRLPTPTDLLAIRSFAINSETSIREAVQHRFPAWTNLVPAIEQVLSDYDSRKAAQKSFDFDDLLVWALKVGDWLIDQKPPFKFSHLIIDEAQDISRIQLNLIHKLYQAAGGKLRLFFVGDPNQSIFGFRGAFPDVFVKISHLWPMTKFITLTGSYRSNQGILDLASAIEEPLCKKRTRPLVARRQA
jgi:DNA helicase-2/ATP-dependent DNA helicase PcrA